MAGIYPIILCGGSGSRLWPSSRRESPKQFQPVGGGQSLSFLQATIQRHMVGDIEAPVVVTNQRFAGLVRQQMSEIQCAGDLIYEPAGRNTGPAVLAACLRIMQRDPQATVVVLPSDHTIKGDMNPLFFEMRKATDEGRIVIFGINPLYPETGYGYITDGGHFLNYPGLHRVEAFVEKPPLEKAKALIATGAAYWASGISMFRASTLVQEFGIHDVDTLRAVQGALAHGTEATDGILLDSEHFMRATNAPTEQIIFENSALVSLAPAQVEWSDVGSWAAMYDIGTMDQDGNVTDGDVLAVGTSNSLIRSQDRLVTVIGMSDLVVVDTPDALLVAPKSRSQEVKRVVGRLEADSRSEVMRHRDQVFSWGAKRMVSSEPSVEVEMLEVKPGAHVPLETNGKATTVMPLTSDMGLTHDGLRAELVAGERTLLEGSTNYLLTNHGSQMAKLMLIITANAFNALTDGDELRFA